MTAKSVLALLLTAALLTTAGCSIIADSDQTDPGSSKPGETDGDIPDGSSSGADSSGQDLPELVSPGDPLAYFGQTMDQIRDNLGEPGDRGLYEGAEYFSYNDRGIALFFWAKPDEDTVVRSIYLSRGAEAAGIKVGMTFAEIKAVLGAPISEGYSEYEEAYSLVCDYEQFRFFFVADSIDGPTTSVRVKYIIDT